MSGSEEQTVNNKGKETGHREDKEQIFSPNNDDIIFICYVGLAHNEMCPLHLRIHGETWAPSVL